MVTGDVCRRKRLLRIGDLFVHHRESELCSSQGGAPMAHPEDELERLTKKMLFDMDNPPSQEYFGKKDVSHTHKMNLSNCQDAPGHLNRTGTSNTCG